MRKQPRLLIGFGIAAVIIFGVSIFALSTMNKNKGTVTVDSVPGDLTLILDGKRVSSIGTFSVSPGKHTFKATRSGFADKETTFEIKQGEKKEFQFYLAPNNDDGLRWQTENQEEVRKVEGAASQEFDRLSQQATEENPIISELPVIDNTFRIDYGTSKKNPDKPGAVALYIEYYTDTGQEDALNWMRTFDHNPADYEIIFVNGIN